MSRHDHRAGLIRRSIAARRLGVPLAITANSGTRPVVALAAGGWASGLRVGAALASGLTGPWTASAWWP